MKIQNKAVGVLERTSQYLQVGLLKDKPAWVDVVGANPPSLDLTRRPKKFETNSFRPDPKDKLGKKGIKGTYYKTRSNNSERQQQNNSVNRVPKLQFLEDKLRDLFYHQHPWEFARPKTLIENKGEEWKTQNWSRMLQLSKPLDGESVVQRTVWLLQNKPFETESKRDALYKAYDQARFEFYRLRMEDEMSSTVSKEESSMYGAVAVSSQIARGLYREQGAINKWALNASSKTEMLKARNSTKPDAEGVEEEEEQSIWDQELDAENKPEEGNSGTKE